MLTILLRLVGEQNIQSFKGHIRDLVEEGSARFRLELRDVGLAVVFMALGALALVATIGLGTAAFYGWLERYYGQLAALLAVGCVTAILAAVMFAAAWRRTRKSTSARNSSKPAPPTSRPAVLAPPAVEPAPVHLSVPPPPANASVADLLAHRFAHRALAASDEAIDRAAGLVREGSPGALVGTLAIAMLIGVVIGQRGLHDLRPSSNAKDGNQR
jgi:hypothetical protein